MDIITNFQHIIDSFLIYFYRLSDNPMLGYYLGTFILSLICVLIGELSIAIAFRVNKKQINLENHEIEHYQNLSIEALKYGDKTAYKACNGIANKAYGKSFFSRIALSASSLWPIFIALGWMQYRFSGVEFGIPLTEFTVGYLPTFLLAYVLTRILFGKLKRNFLNLIKA